MKGLPLHIIILCFIFSALCASYGETSVGKSLQEREHCSIYNEFRKLEQKRPTIQATPADDPIRTRHIAQLRELYRRAKIIDDFLLPVTIHTELNQFGITIAKESSWRCNADETVTPKALVHPATHNIYYLESDGRHVTAIGPDGTLIWHRDPFNDAGLEPYRFSKPVINHFDFSSRDPKTTGIAVTFNSSQFGSMDLSTGDFHWSGQN